MVSRYVASFASLLSFHMLSPPSSRILPLSMTVLLSSHRYTCSVAREGRAKWAWHNNGTKIILKKTAEIELKLNKHASLNYNIMMMITRPNYHVGRDNAQLNTLTLRSNFKIIADREPSGYN
jgi:hypothetical protein